MFKFILQTSYSFFLVKQSVITRFVTDTCVCKCNIALCQTCNTIITEYSEARYKQNERRAGSKKPCKTQITFTYNRVLIGYIWFPHTLSYFDNIPGLVSYLQRDRQVLLFSSQGDVTNCYTIQRKAELSGTSHNITLFCISRIASIL